MGRGIRQTVVAPSEQQLGCTRAGRRRSPGRAQQRSGAGPRYPVPLVDEHVHRLHGRRDAANCRRPMLPLIRFPGLTDLDLVRFQDTSQFTEGSAPAHRRSLHIAQPALSRRIGASSRAARREAARARPARGRPARRRQQLLDDAVPLPAAATRPAAACSRPRPGRGAVVGFRAGSSPTAQSWAEGRDRASGRHGQGQALESDDQEQNGARRARRHRLASPGRRTPLELVPLYSERRPLAALPADHPLAGRRRR